MCHDFFPFPSIIMNPDSLTHRSHDHINCQCLHHQRDEPVTSQVTLPHVYVMSCCALITDEILWKSISWLHHKLWLCKQYFHVLIQTSLVVFYVVIFWLKYSNLITWTSNHESGWSILGSSCPSVICLPFRTSVCPSGYPSVDGISKAYKRMF